MKSSPLLRFVLVSQLFGSLSFNGLKADDSIPDVSKIAVPWPPPRDPKESPFTKFPCTSYSGYKSQNIVVNPVWRDCQPEDFGPRQVIFDYSGVRTLNQVPPPGIHPRIFCTPADRDNIRRRLKETRCGQEMWKNLLCYVNYMKGQFDPKADYAAVPESRLAAGEKLRVPFNRFEVDSGKQEKVAARYQALITETSPRRQMGSGTFSLWKRFDAGLMMTKLRLTILPQQ